MVLLTGSTSGIGLGIARQFARTGARIARCGLESSDQAQEFMQLVQQESSHPPLYMQADVTKPDELSHFVQRTIDQFGRIYVLASNAIDYAQFSADQTYIIDGGRSAVMM